MALSILNSTRYNGSIPTGTSHRRTCHIGATLFLLLDLNSFLVMPNVISLMGLSAKMNYVQEAILDNDSVLKNAESNIVEN